MVAEVGGLGPLEPLVGDPEVSEVMVNGPDRVFVERRGRVERVPCPIDAATIVRIAERVVAPLGLRLDRSSPMVDARLLQIIDRIVSKVGRRVDDVSPMVDARLPDGSRVNAIIPPLSLVGPVLTIRKFSASPFTVDDLVRFGTATADMFDFLKACVEARLNIFVSGGTGSGKTTTLNVLSSFIPNDERIITIEDAAELQLRQEHVVTLESRPPNIEGRGAVPDRKSVV